MFVSTSAKRQAKTLGRGQQKVRDMILFNEWRQDDKARRSRKRLQNGPKSPLVGGGIVPARSLHSTASTGGVGQKEKPA